MRLHLPSIDAAQRRQNTAERLKLSGCDRQGGPVCRPDCPDAKLRACSPCCPQAPEALTCDPKFPVESRILPLVFELKATGIFEPVWSCEGHYATSGEIHRRPSVWFCCESLPQMRALAETIASLCFAKKTSATWRIMLVSAEENSENTVFKLEPDIAAGTRLEHLHTDIAELAKHLRRHLSANA